MDKEQRIQFLECLHLMWKSFMKVATINDSEVIEQFMDAKDKAHELLSKIESNKLM